MRVAARHACGDQFSGFVSERMRAQAGREGMILKAFGRGPERYLPFWRRKPTLRERIRERDS